MAARVRSDPAFAQALLDEAITLFVNGEPESAKPLLLSLAYVPALLPAQGVFVAFGGHLEKDIKVGDRVGVGFLRACRSDVKPCPGAPVPLG